MYQEPDADMDVAKLLNGLINAATELGELTGREEDDGTVERQEERVSRWRTAVQERIAVSKAATPTQDPGWADRLANGAYER